MPLTFVAYCAILKYSQALLLVMCAAQEVFIRTPGCPPVVLQYSQKEMIRMKLLPTMPVCPNCGAKLKSKSVKLCPKCGHIIFYTVS